LRARGTPQFVLWNATLGLVPKLLPATLLNMTQLVVVANGQPAEWV
jgi:hypothetical protein